MFANEPDAWSRLAASFQSVDGSFLKDSRSSEDQSYKVTIIASTRHANDAISSAVPASRGPEYVLYELDLQELVRRSSELHSDERMDQVLSIVQTGQRDLERWGQIENFYGVAAFECLCGRFMACIALLSMPDACKLDDALGQDPAAPYLVLEWLRQVTVECSRLFEQIFTQLNAFNHSKRNKDYRRDKGVMAHHLGRVHSSIRGLNTNMQAWPHFCFSVANLNIKVNLACDTLNFYASLHRDEFWGGAKTKPGQYTGIHVLSGHCCAGNFSLSGAFTFTEIMKKHARHLEINSQYPVHYLNDRTLASTMQYLNKSGNPSPGIRQMPQCSTRPQDLEESGQSAESIPPGDGALDWVSSEPGLKGQEGCLSPSAFAE
ncbi:MAG: hypothetical protein Q9191_005481 [Dirinaria sp. TL-2023a]